MCVCRHQLFVNMVRQHAQTPDIEPPNPYSNIGRVPNRPLDLPVYGKQHMAVESVS